MKTDASTIALRYVEACGRGDFDAVVPLLAHDVVFQSPWGRVVGSKATLQMLIKLARHWKGAQVRKVFTDGCESCVIHDLPFATVPAVEWVKVDQGRVCRLTVLLDRLQLGPAGSLPAPRPSQPA